MCSKHTKEKEGLYVKASTIPGAGDGLFASRDIPANHSLGLYVGEKVSPEVLEAYRGVTPYVLCNMAKTLCVDARKTNSTPLRYINSPHNTGREANVAFVHNHRRQRDFPMRVIRPVYKGEEFLVDYGDDYFQDV